MHDGIHCATALHCLRRSRRARKKLRTPLDVSVGFTYHFLAAEECGQEKPGLSSKAQILIEEANNENLRIKSAMYYNAKDGARYRGCFEEAFS